MGWLWILISGCFAGLMSGFLGVGGGTVIVPALNFIFSSHGNLDVSADIAMHMASGSALCTMIFTSATSVRVHFKHGSRAWLYFRRLLPFIIVGIVIGAVLADFLPNKIMKQIFGVFLLLIALEMQFGRLISRVRLRPTPFADGLICMCIGMVSGMLGIGGGALMIPYLSRCRMTMRKITSIAAICSLTVGLFGTLAVIFTGYNNTNTIPWATGYVFWPAVLLAGVPSILFAKFAAKKVYTMPLKYVRAFFITFLYVAGIRMVM